MFLCAAELGLKLPLALSFSESHFSIKWFAYHKIIETSYNISSFPTQVKGFLGETSIFWGFKCHTFEHLSGRASQTFCTWEWSREAQICWGLFLLILMTHITGWRNIFFFLRVVFFFQAGRNISKNMYVYTCIHIRYCNFPVQFYLYTSYNYILFFSPTPLPEWPSHSSVQDLSVGPCC